MPAVAGCSGSPDNCRAAAPINDFRGLGIRGFRDWGLGDLGDFGFRVLGFRD